MITKSDDERFQNGAQDYAAYLESPEGRLRADLAFANLHDFLAPPQATEADVCSGRRMWHGSDGGSPGTARLSRHPTGFVSGDA